MVPRRYIGVQLVFEQWGYVAGTSRPLSCTLPLSFSTVYTAVAGCKANNVCGDGNSWYVEGTTIKLWGHAGSQDGKTFILLCK